MPERPKSTPNPDNIPVLLDDSIRSAIDIDLALQAVMQAYVEYGSERRVLSSPPAMSLASDNEEVAAFKVKGARLQSLGIAGFRMIADRIIEGTDATIDYCWVADAITGRPIGLVNETWLHRLRTALTGVVAAQWLANSQSSVITIIGAGKIADELPGPLSRVFAVREIRVVARHMETAARFANRHGKIAALHPFVNVDKAVEGADIIICISSAASPVLHASAITPGTTICGMGGGPEIGVDVFDRCDRFVVDDLEYAFSIGSVKGWIAEGRNKHDIASRVDADLGQIALRAKFGRLKKDDIILSIVQGMACCDLALAHLALVQTGIAPSAAPDLTERNIFTDR